jgi:hypothetical protein
MKPKLLASLFFTAAVVTPWFPAAARACTIGEGMETHVPFGATDISNAD